MGLTEKFKVGDSIIFFDVFKVWQFATIKDIQEFSGEYYFTLCGSDKLEINGSRLFDAKKLKKVIVED